MAWYVGPKTQPRIDGFQTSNTPVQGNINGSGVCCNELDIWEANARATHIAPHPCNVPGLYACDADGEDCGDNGVCDKSGVSRLHECFLAPRCLPLSAKTLLLDGISQIADPVYGSVR